MDNLTLTRKARHLAKELLKQAKENEPTITADLQSITRKISAEMAGLENKFKTEMSLTRKLLLLAGKDKTRQSFEQKLEKL